MIHTFVLRSVVVAVLALPLHVASCGSSNAPSDPVRTIDVVAQFITTNSLDSSTSFDQAQLHLYGEDSQELPNTMGTYASVTVYTDQVYDAHNMHKKVSDVRLPASWKFESTDVGFCYDVFGPTSGMHDGGTYFYQCHRDFADTELVSESAGGYSLDQNGEAVLDANYVGDQLTEDQQFLFPGDGLISENGLYTLVFLSDGNLVMYDDTYQIIWQTYTYGYGGGGSHTHLQDGNLVVYNADVSPVFASNTGDHYGAYLWCQNDGNLVIYDAYDNVLWAIW